MLTIQELIKMLKHLKSNEIIKILTKTTTVAVNTTAIDPNKINNIKALNKNQTTGDGAECYSLENVKTSNHVSFSTLLLSVLENGTELSSITSSAGTPTPTSTAIATTSQLPKQQRVEQQQLEHNQKQKQQLHEDIQHKHNQNRSSSSNSNSNKSSSSRNSVEHEQLQQQHQWQEPSNESSQQANTLFSFTSNLNEKGCTLFLSDSKVNNSILSNKTSSSTQDLIYNNNNNKTNKLYENFILKKPSSIETLTSSKLLSAASSSSSSISSATASASTSAIPLYLQQQRSQKIQNFYQQQLHHFHTQHNQSLWTKQKLTKFAMSSLAAEPLTALKQDDFNDFDSIQQQQQLQIKQNGISCNSEKDLSNSSTTSAKEQNVFPASTSGKPCFNTGLPELLKFMELIGNLKHTKRTGWVLRDVNDCESISGHMYRMSILTFLLDGSEGLNQIRCMELALVHDMAESLVGDITPFCGITKDEKRAMEFKAMEDICNLIEPRGKRIMELFEEYEKGESPESKFVKDLDRLDMVMQAFEYEKRDNCLLKHQEFFDSTKGKFNHPFVKKLVNEIYEQRESLAKAKGASPPPTISVPEMVEASKSTASTSTSSSATSTTTPAAVVGPETATASASIMTNGHSKEPKASNGTSS